MNRMELINWALMKTGLPLADNEGDLQWDSVAIYESVATELLRGFPWNFARRLAVFELAAGRPAFGYSYAYVKPMDCLRVVDVRSGWDIRAPRARFEDVGDAVYTNASPCNARYVYRELDPARWAPDFADAVACRIACEIAGKAAQRMDLAQQLLEVAERALSRAKDNDAREYMEHVPTENLFVDARNRR